MKDLLTALTARLPKRTNGKGPKPSDLGVPSGTGSERLLRRPSTRVGTAS
jgi:hypothetical protein